MTWAELTGHQWRGQSWHSLPLLTDHLWRGQSWPNLARLIDHLWRGQGWPSLAGLTDHLCVSVGRREGHIAPCDARVGGQFGGIALFIFKKPVEKVRCGFGTDFRLGLCVCIFFALVCVFSVMIFFVIFYLLVLLFFIYIFTRICIFSCLEFPFCLRRNKKWKGTGKEIRRRRKMIKQLRKKTPGHIWLIFHWLDIKKVI